MSKVNPNLSTLQSIAERDTILVRKFFRTKSETPLPGGVPRFFSIYAVPKGRVFLMPNIHQGGDSSQELLRNFPILGNLEREECDQESVEKIQITGHSVVDAISQIPIEGVFVANAWFAVARYSNKRGTFTDHLACHLLGLITDVFWVKNTSGHPAAISLAWKNAFITLTPDLWEVWVNFFGITPKVIKDSLKVLIENRLLTTHPPLSAIQAAEILKQKKPQILAASHYAYKSCSWCLAKTSVLHEHHFPILKSKGGIDTVCICPNCHSEFHVLIDSPIVRLTSKVFEVIDLEVRQ